MSSRGRQRRHRVTAVNSLPGNATPEERKEAERNFERATAAATLTRDQVKRQGEIRYRGGKFDGKDRRTRTRRARRESAIREQE
ncbi:MAG: hypothetical protein WBP22_05760 [Candidatus Saccharimonas sp.]